MKKQAVTATDKMPALKAYGHDLTEMCREGKMDPVIGRKEEVERLDPDPLPPPQKQPCSRSVKRASVKQPLSKGLPKRLSKEKFPIILRKKKLITLDLGSDDRRDEIPRSI